MAQSARAGFADGDRFADQRWCAFVVDLGFCGEGETWLDDDVFVVQRWTWADSGAVGAEAIGVN